MKSAVGREKTPLRSHGHGLVLFQWLGSSRYVESISMCMFTLAEVKANVSLGVVVYSSPSRSF